MAKKAIVVDYNKGRSEDPQIAAEFVSVEAAIDEFEKLKEANKGRTVLLFNTLTAEVEKIALLGEPIYLAKALTFARTFVPHKTLMETVGEGTAKAVASTVVGEIVKCLAGGPVPGVGGAVLGHFIAPYYAFQGDGKVVAKTGRVCTGDCQGL